MEQQAFIDRVKTGAMQGWKDRKVLPSVSIAQAILESGWGDSGLTTQSNNLFGIKADSTWKGRTVNMRTAEYDGNGNKYYINADFRAYDSLDASILDHSNYFYDSTGTNVRSRYAAFIGETDYKKACVALQASGYATASNYGSTLVSLIEKYKLYEYDKEVGATTSNSVPQAATPSATGPVWGKFIFDPITNKNNFGGTRNKSSIKYIAIHWTANTAKGANAAAHRKYFQNNNVGASAHLFADDKSIVQIVGESVIAYAVGGDQGYGTGLNGCVNGNSISIEMCYNSDSDLDRMYFLTVELVKALLLLYPNAIVCRHWDATRKDCPHGYTSSSSKWTQFLADIKKPRRLAIDLSKSSDIYEINGGYASAVSEVPAISKPVVEITQGGYSVITNTPGDVLNLREQASPSSKIISTYADGSKIYVSEVHKVNGKTWYKIGEGFVSAFYCKPAPEEFAPAPTSTPNVEVKPVEVEAPLYDLITYASDPDRTYAELLEERIGVPAMHVDNYAKNKDKYKSIIHIGGSGAPAEASKVIAGSNRDETYELVIEFIKMYSRRYK